MELAVDNFVRGNLLRLSVDNSNCPATNLNGSGLCHPIDRDYGHRNIHRPH